MNTKSFRRNEDGAAMAELAVVIGVFSLILLGLVEFGIANYEKNTITAAARDGARYAIVRSAESGRATDTAAVSSYVRGRTGLSPIRVTTTWPTTNIPGSVVHVKVAYTHKLATPIVGAVLPDSVVLASTSRMHIVF